MQTRAALEGRNPTNKTHIPCYLIGQLGRSDVAPKGIGVFVLIDAVEEVKFCQKRLGGRFIMLDAVNHPKVIKFYQSVLFFPIERSTRENIRMVRPLAGF